MLVLHTGKCHTRLRPRTCSTFSTSAVRVRHLKFNRQQLLFDSLLWDLPGDVLAAPASALCGWKGVNSLSLIV